MKCAYTVIAILLFAACGDSPEGGKAVDPAIAASLAAFENRKIYTKLDPAILRNIPDSEVEQAVVDYAFSKLENNYQREVEIVSDLPPGVRAHYITWTVEAEVNNGGFNQYYFNTDGKFAAEAVNAFEYFGASEHAALMREANSLRAAESKDMARFKDAGTIEEFSESYKHSKLGPLDDRFYKLSENLSQLRIARIRELPDQFSGN